MAENEDEKQQRAKMVVALATIPFVLAVPPMIGWFIGNWLDKQIGTAPFLMYSLIILGFVAAVRECYRLIKTYGNRA